MANLTFQIPDAKMAELVEAWSVGYLEEVPDPDNPGEMKANPQNKQAFAKEQIRKVIADRVRTHAATLSPEFPIT